MWRYQPTCGLVNPSDNKPVPLKSIAVKVNVKGFVADVTSKLHYNNELDNPIEALFVFPLDEQCAIYSFKATIDDRVIVAECQEKSEAKKTYNEAKAAGHTAIMLEESDHSGDVFKCSIGNLPAKKDATIEFSYAMELSLEADGAVKFNLPLTIMERYLPDNYSPEGIDTEAGEKPTPMSPVYWGKNELPYTFSFDVGVSSSTAISDIKGDGNAINWTPKNGDKSLAEAKLADGADLAKGIKLLIYYTDNNQPYGIYEKGDPDGKGLLTKDCVMINFFPTLDDEEEIAEQEFIFVLDRSGSMGGDSIVCARETLILFLKSLPVGCYFNIVSFGSSHSCLFPQSVPYDQENLQRAVSAMENVDADMGGTEILRPLEAIYKNDLKQGFGRQIFLLTDGGVGNVDQCVQIVKKNAETSRVFSFGIGTGVSTALVKGLARAGRGICELIEEAKDMHAKVVRVLRCALQPAVSNVTLTWEDVPGNAAVHNVPTKIPPVFFSERLIAYGLVDNDQSAPSGSGYKVKLSAEVDKKPLVYYVQGKVPESHDQNSVIHRLAAKALVKELEALEDDTKKEDIINASVSANVASKFTSFVGVDTSVKDPTSKDRIMKVDIPLPRYQDNITFGCAATGMMMRSMACNAPAPMMCAPQNSSCLKKKARAMPRRIMKKSAPAPKSGGIRRGASSQYESMEQEEKPTIDYSSLAGTERVMELVKLQQFDGHWKFSDILCKLLGKTEDVLKAAAGISNMNAWITALVIAFLDSKHQNEKGQWDIVVSKSRKWLKKSGNDYESIKETALKTIM